MKLIDLIKIARSTAQDTAKPYLWTDDEWIEYANHAEQEACRRARLIVDSSTDAITKLAVKSGKAVYDLDSRVIFVRRVKLATKTQPLGKISYKDLDRQAPGWEEHTGDVRGYITDMDTGKLRLYEIPNAADVVRLTVVRLPLQDMGKQDEPEIAGRYHRGLLNWMLFRAYSKDDEETKDDQKAAKYAAAFTAEFGQLSTAVDETWIENNHGYDDAEGLY